MNCFADALQYCVTVFKRNITEKEVKMTSQLGLWIIDGGIQLSTQNNIKLQRLADCDINCTVYNGLQLLYKEKLKRRFLLYSRVKHL